MKGFQTKKIILFYVFLFFQEKQPEIKNNDGNKMLMENLNVSGNNSSASPQKSPSKAPLENAETLKVEKAQPANETNNNKNITNVDDDKKKPEEVNDGSNDDDDDSVFLKNETTKTDASSVKSSKTKTSSAVAAQNLTSRESNVQSETVVR